MSYKHEKINVAEGIDIDKASLSKECMLCRYWCFQHVGYKFEPQFVINVTMY